MSKHQEERLRLINQRRELEAKYGTLAPDEECPGEVLKHCREVIRYARNPKELREVGYP